MPHTLILCPYLLLGEFPRAVICSEIAVDERFDPFPVVNLPFEEDFRGYEVFGVSTTFELLRDPATLEYVKVYNMPVFYSSKTYPGKSLCFSCLLRTSTYCWREALINHFLLQPM